MSRNALRFNKLATETENMDKRDERDILEEADYQDKPASRKFREFGKRWNKANKPQRGGIRD